ncbi:hypothetical protein WG66_004949 [Moniliophthora roreri]|nr:hypothetical protein WG66_004949 [Moniliophthora roreri]
MSFLQRASQFTNQGGNFTCVTGNLVQNLQQKEREWTIWDETTLEDTGKLTEVGRVWGARRIASVACLYGEDKGLESLPLKKTSSNSLASGDLPSSSSVATNLREDPSSNRKVHVVQLFVSVTMTATIRHQHRFFMTRLFQLSISLNEADFPALYICIFIHSYSNLSLPQFGVVSIADDTADFGDLWVDPRTGALRKGPYVGYSFNRTFTAAGFEENVAARGEHHLLPIHAYSDSVFTYLTSVLSTKILVQGINLSSRGSLERVPTEDAVTRLTLLPGTVYIRSCRMVVAKRPGDVKGWYYSLQCVRGVPDAMHQVRMDDSSLRYVCTVKSGYLCSSGMQVDDLTVGHSALAEPSSTTNYILS